MSGRSGYRKTDRKRNRWARPRPRSDYVLRFQLPPTLAAFVAPGGYSFGVTVGYNDVVFIAGRNPAHCCQLAADFLDEIGGRRALRRITAQVVKLLPCSAHLPAPAVAKAIFKKPAIDVEALHDRVSRFSACARGVSIDIGPDAIAFNGCEGWRFAIVHDYGTGRDRQSS